MHIKNKKKIFGLDSVFFNITKIKDKSFVIFFHGVEEVIIDKEIQNVHISLKNFKNIIDNLQNNFEIIPFSELINLVIKKKDISNKIAITFDDGYKNNYDLVYPFLKKNKIPFLIYLTTNYISSEKKMPNFLIRLFIKYTNKKNFYSKFYKKEFDISSKYKKKILTDKYISYAKNFEFENIHLLINDLKELISSNDIDDLLKIFRSENFLTWSEIKNMTDFCEFGSHTGDHYIFNEKNKINGNNQLILSKNEIIKNLGKCEHFALPNGNSNEFIKYLVNERKFPYKTISTTEKKFINFEDDVFVPRFGVSNTNSLIKLFYDLWQNA